MTWLDLKDNVSETTPRVVDNKNHTMGASALKKYVIGKFTKGQQALLERAARELIPVEIHGIYDGHVSELFKQRGYTYQKKDRHARKSRSGKLFNNLRPVLYNCSHKKDGTRLILTVFPSPDYVDQYAELTLAFMGYKLRAQRKSVKLLNDIVRVFHYPDYEKKVSEWTEFEKGLKNIIRSGDICVIGEVKAITENLENLDFTEFNEEWKWFGIDNIFACRIHSSPITKRRLVLVGFRHSFWGSAAGKFARALAKAGCGHIIYAAKCGVLINKEMIHKVICPRSYYIAVPIRQGYRLDSYEVFSTLRDHNKGLVEGIESGIHLNVPTVVGETFTQLDEYRKLRPATIDNEIGYIAKELHNLRKDKCPVEFTALHFTTDYVKDDKYKDEEAEYNLAHKGGQNAGKKGKKVDEYKKIRFQHISAIINNYALHNGALIDAEVSSRGAISTLAEYGETISHLRALAEGSVMADSRRDVGDVLDGWLAAFYYGNLQNYMKLIKNIKRNQKSCEPSVANAIKWVELATKYVSVYSSNEIDSTVKVQEFGYVITNTDKMLSGNGMPKLLGGLCADLIGSSFYNKYKILDDESDLHESVRYYTIAIEKLTESTNNTTTRQFWLCYANKLKGLALLNMEERNKAKSYFRKAEKEWLKIIDGMSADTLKHPKLIAEGELAQVRLAMLNNYPADSRKKAILRDTESFLCRASNIFPLVENTRRIYNEINPSDPKKCFEYS